VAAIAQISEAAPAEPTANVVDADVSLVKPLPCTEQFEKRSHAVPLSLSETTHGPWHEMSNGLSIPATFPPKRQMTEEKTS
jgi:hypothetical protein